MTTKNIAQPSIVTNEEWLEARKTHLAGQRLTKHRDRINAERRRLPMVKIEKDYVFDGPNGKQSLKALFDGRRQLIVYHFMFDPAWDKGCPRLHGLCECPGRSVDAERPRHDFRARFPRPAGQARSLQSAKGMERPVVFLIWQRFQLRFSRHAGREGRARRIQLSG